MRGGDLKDHAAHVRKETGKPRLSRPAVGENDDGTITFKTKRKSPNHSQEGQRRLSGSAVPQFDAKCQPIMPMVGSVEDLPLI